MHRRAFRAAQLVYFVGRFVPDRWLNLVAWLALRLPNAFVLAKSSRR